MGGRCLAGQAGLHLRGVTKLLLFPSGGGGAECERGRVEEGRPAVRAAEAGAGRGRPAHQLVSGGGPSQAWGSLWLAGFGLAHAQGRFPCRRYVWRTYTLTFGGEKLNDDKKKLRE